MTKWKGCALHLMLIDSCGWHLRPILTWQFENIIFCNQIRSGKKCWCALGCASWVCAILSYTLNLCIILYVSRRNFWSRKFDTDLSVCFQEHLLIVCELLKANLYEFHKFNRESGGEVYFTMPRLQVCWIKIFIAIWC